MINTTSQFSGNYGTKGRQMAKRSMKLGGGGRFQKLKGELAHRKGIKNPGALAAYIGRKKYGDKKMGKMSAQGRKRRMPEPMSDAKFGVR